MFNRVMTLAVVELYKFSRQKYSYLLILFVVINAGLVGAGSRIFPAIISAMRGLGGPQFDGYTFASIIATGTFSSAGAGTIAMLAFSGSLVAAETDSGTLKNVLVRPVKRHEFILAKAAALFVYCLVIVIVTALLSMLAGALFYGLGDLAIPETGEVYRTRPEMLMNMGVSYLMDLFSIYTVGCMGLFISVAINNAGWAVITSLVVYFPVMFLKNFEFMSPWIFTSYMDLGQSILREMAVVKSKAWTPDIYSFFAVNILTAIVFLSVSLLLFRRKEVH
jgi:ABC-type transport system involved in multi-copper enzyme maturation permease subunit